MGKADKTEKTRLSSKGQLIIPKRIREAHGWSSGMIAVDTNIIVRLLTGDDHRQSRVSQHLFRDNAVFIPDTVLLETEWVLRDAYDLPASNINLALRKLIGLPGVSVRDARLLVLALDWHAGGMDFADAMHLALSQHQPVVTTFDRQFIGQSAPGSRCTVAAP